MKMERALTESMRPQRAAGRGEIGVRFAEGQTRLERFYQEGCAKIRLPRRADAIREAVLINSSGGLTGGDRLAWRAEVGNGAELQVTTQACEKIYRADDGRAEIASTITVGAGGRIAWLPQETILFADSALSRSLEMDLAEGAEALVVEATLFGRSAMGERVTRALFRDRWRIRVCGRLVHAEDFSIGPDVARALARSAVMAGATAAATILLIAPDASAHLDAVRELIGKCGGASFWRVGKSGKLLARLIAEDGYDLRQRLIPVLELLNGRAALPKVWSL